MAVLLTMYRLLRLDTSEKFAGVIGKLLIVSKVQDYSKIYILEDEEKEARKGKQTKNNSS